MSRYRILDRAAKALVGTEKLAPEIESAARKYVSSTGRINHEALGKRRLLGDLLIGKKGVTEALKARYRQGGVIGPGGLIRGELALDPRFKELVRNYKQAPSGSTLVDPYTGQVISRAKATRMLATKGLGQSINPLFLLGFPAADVATAIATPDADEHGGMSGILGGLAGGAGFAIGGPLGLVGGIGASMLGENLGKAVGGVFDPSDTSFIPSSSTAGATRLPRASDVILDAAVPR